jgi:hypothetical protein
MAKQSDTTIGIDPKVIKTIEADFGKLSADGKKLAKNGSPCSEEMSEWRDADRAAATALAALLAAMVSGQPPAVYAAAAAFAAAMSKYIETQQEWLECLEEHNDRSAPEHKKRLKTMEDIKAKITRQKDQLKKTMKK